MDKKQPDNDDKVSEKDQKRYEEHQQEMRQKLSEFKENNQEYIEETSAKFQKACPRELSLAKNKPFVLLMLAFTSKHQSKRFDARWERHQKETNLCNLPNLKKANEDLPNEIWIGVIFPCLSLRNLCNLRETNKKFNTLIVFFLDKTEYPLLLKTNNTANCGSLKHAVQLLVDHAGDGLPTSCPPPNAEWKYISNGHKKIANLMQSHPVTLDYTFNSLGTSEQDLLKTLIKATKNAKSPIIIKLTFPNGCNIFDIAPLLIQIGKYIEELTVRGMNRGESSWYWEPSAQRVSIEKFAKSFKNLKKLTIPNDFFGHHLSNFVRHLKTVNPNIKTIIVLGVNWEHISLTQPPFAHYPENKNHKCRVTFDFEKEETNT